MRRNRAGAPLTLEERNRLRHEEMEREADVLDIQELEDDGGEDITRKVAEPPKAAGQRCRAGPRQGRWGALVDVRS